MSSVTTEENCDNTCVVCFKNVEIFSVGECDHPVCYECSTRMRVLCGQAECPICRQDMQKVIFTKTAQPFKEIKNGTQMFDRKFKIDFDSLKVRQAYDALLSHVCQRCPEKIAFQTFLLLKEHMRRSHERFYCELCVDNLKMFDRKFKIDLEIIKVKQAYDALLFHVCQRCPDKIAFQIFLQLKEQMRRSHEWCYCGLCIDNLKILTCERKCYTRSELEQHQRKGDPDDRSHRGHPLCQFCDKRYMDKDELCRHLRRDHLYCHFCDADGYNHYYSSYDTLRDHFRSEHYLCEEGTCYEEKFIAVFRTDIDLKAHRASAHGRTIGKAATKQARTLELAFRLAPRPGLEYRRGGGSRNSRYTEEWEDQGAAGGYDDEQNYFGSHRNTNFSTINTDCINEFPSLGGSSGMGSQPQMNRKHGSNVTIRAAVKSGRELAITDENFPALGPEATVSLRVNSSASERPKSTGAVTKKPTNFSIHVNHRPNSVLTRVTSSGGGGSGSSGQSNNNYKAKEDFPALCNAKMSQPVLQIASSQWSSGREPDSKVSIIKSKNSQSNVQQPTTKPKDSFALERDNFPQLSSRFEASCSVKPETKVRPTSAQPLLMSESKQKKATSLTVPVNDLWVPLTRDQSNNSVVSGDSESGNKSGSKKKKKKSGGKNSGTNSNVDINKNSHKKTEHDNKKPNNDSKKKKHQDGQSGIANGKKEGNKKSVNTVERKRAELNVGKLVDQSDHKHSTNNNNDSNSIDSNSLQFGSKPPDLVNAPKDKPPPGFEMSAKTNPPPGFSIKLNSIARPPNASNGLTFTNSSGQSYPITPGSNNLTPTSHTFVQPDNFAPRNGNLVESVMKALKDYSKLDEFRNMSLRFRQNELSAKDYYNHCQEAMGSDFEVIFPELIVLLPDIDKQQELWTVHQMLGKPTGSINVSKNCRLDICAICRQVLNASDVPQHQTSHDIESEFPLLSNGLLNHSWIKK